MSIDRIAVVGGGTMGNGIAHVAAVAGRQVRLLDVGQPLVEAALAQIGKNLDRQIKKGTLDEATKAAILGRIQTGTDLAAGVADVDLVVEAVPEKVELKEAIFGTLDRSAPEHAILASNTSSISITTIAAFTKRPDKVIGMHFMNPVPLMPLVEVIRGHLTSDETTALVVAAAKAMGKVPVEVQDYPGFVSNRVLLPMINEAVQCVMEGVATPEAVDQVMKLGMNHPMGPLALADLIGLDTCLAILEVLQKGLGDDKYRPSPLLRRMVQAGLLGRKSGRGFYAYER